MKTVRNSTKRDYGTSTANDILTIIENNRTRIQTRSGTVLNVCGFLLSSSFVILFFVISNPALAVTPVSLAFLLSTIVCLVFSIVYSILSIHLPKSATILTKSKLPTKLQLIDQLTLDYHREYRRALIAIRSLMIAIFLFIGALSAFAINFF